MAKTKGYKNLSPDESFGKGYFYSVKELKELNEFRAEHGLRPLRQDFCTCLMCGQVFKSPDITNRRICGPCHSDDAYTSEAAGITAYDILEMFEDDTGYTVFHGNPTRDKDFGQGELGLKFSGGRHRE